jgi:hypothetical protein
MNSISEVFQWRANVNEVFNHTANNRILYAVFQLIQLLGQSPGNMINGTTAPL